MVFSNFEHNFFQQELTVPGMSVLRKKECVRSKKLLSGLHISCSGGDTAAPGAKGQPEKNTHFQEHPDWRASILCSPSLHLQPCRTKSGTLLTDPLQRNSYCVWTSGVSGGLEWQESSLFLKAAISPGDPMDNSSACEHRTGSVLYSSTSCKPGLTQGKQELGLPGTAAFPAWLALGAGGTSEAVLLVWLPSESQPSLHWGNVLLTVPLKPGTVSAPGLVH